MKMYPAVKETLYDRTEIVRDPAYLTASGLMDRCEIVGGDFFTSVPAGGDAYVLKRILHDWSDQQCVQILRTCREAMGRKARILVVDAVVPPGNELDPAKVMDILMMLLFEGRERTEEEFHQVFRLAGLKLTKVVPTASVLSIVEGEPA
jgi:O-methyltransferase domain